MTQTKLAPLPDIIKANEVDTAKTSTSKAFIALKIPTRHPLSFYAKKDYKKQADGSYIKNGVNPLNNLLLDKRDYSNTSKARSKIVSKTGQVRDNFGTTSGQDENKEWGFYSRKFDEVMEEAGREDKRVVAECLGLKVSSDTFRKILSRKRGGLVPKVRAYRHSPYIIEWIHRNFEKLPFSESVAMLDLKLPLDLHKFVRIPQHSVSGLAGYKSSGKTAFLLEVAELNCLTQEFPIFYFFNEMGQAEFWQRLEDFPNLKQAYEQGKFVPSMQTNYEFGDVVQPDAINLFDYIDRDEDQYLIGQDIRNIYTPLGRGISLFALQKPPGRDLGYGGTPTLKLARFYLKLDVTSKYAKDSVNGQAKIVDCKNWVEHNPKNLKCLYHTGGKHGRLFIDSEWGR